MNYLCCFCNFNLINANASKASADITNDKIENQSKDQFVNLLLWLNNNHNKNNILSNSLL